MLATVKIFVKVGIVYRVVLPRRIRFVSGDIWLTDILVEEPAITAQMTHFSLRFNLAG